MKNKNIQYQKSRDFFVVSTLWSSGVYSFVIVGFMGCPYHHLWAKEAEPRSILCGPSKPDIGIGWGADSTSLEFRLIFLSGCKSVTPSCSVLSSLGVSWHLDLGSLILHISQGYASLRYSPRDPGWSKPTASWSPGFNEAPQRWHLVNHPLLGMIGLELLISCYSPQHPHTVPLINFYVEVSRVPHNHHTSLCPSLPIYAISQKSWRKHSLPPPSSALEICHLTMSSLRNFLSPGDPPPSIFSSPCFYTPAFGLWIKIS